MFTAWVRVPDSLWWAISTVIFRGLSPRLWGSRKEEKLHLRNGLKTVRRTVFLTAFRVPDSPQNKYSIPKKGMLYLWWAIRDSNPGPIGYEPIALTN